MTTTELQMLAVDYGASSGRAMLGGFDGSKLRMKEIHRFDNVPVRLGNSLHWDFPRLFLELQNSIRSFHRETGGAGVSVAVDTWGVDFGLLDRQGALIGNPYHYRDARTNGIPELAAELLPQGQLYAATGIEMMQINTVFQLYSMIRSQSPQLESAETLLFTPDLFNYFLTGERAAEYSIASTSALLDPVRRTWAEQIMKTLGISPSLFPSVVQPGNKLGELSAEVREELQVGRISVINAASHDTASAIAAAPAGGGPFAFISTGTWSLMGVERSGPVITGATEKLAYTNEGGAFGRTLLMKNIMGLWLLQECRRQWRLEGSDLSFAELQELAAREPGHRSFVDPGHPSFLAPNDMPQRIQDFCLRTGQPVPQGAGAISRCILDSLALKYRQTLEELESLTGQTLPIIHMVGGGIQNELLCRLTAEATGRPVVAGPVEATAIGNLLIQAAAQGEIDGPDEIREVVRQSFPPVTYEPGSQADEWQASYETYSRLAQATA